MSLNNSGAVNNSKFNIEELRNRWGEFDEKYNELLKNANRLLESTPSTTQVSVQTQIERNIVDAFEYIAIAKDNNAAFKQMEKLNLLRETLKKLIEERYKMLNSLTKENEKEIKKTGGIINTGNHGNNTNNGTVFHSKLPVPCTIAQAA